MPLTIARIISTLVPDDPRDALAILQTALPLAEEAQLAMTAGGLFRLPWPKNYPGHFGWNTRPEDMRWLERYAEELLLPLLKRLPPSHARYLTLGTDLDSPGTSTTAELVGLYDLKEKRFLHWTGKSYPVGTQETVLARQPDFTTHLLHLQDERLVLLGCHDLNLLSNRAEKAAQRGTGQKIRLQTIHEFRRLLREFRPTLILHHPHGTDSHFIWGVAYSNVREMFPDTSYASGIGYYRWTQHGPIFTPRKSLEHVRASTTNLDDDRILDIIVPFTGGSPVPR
jgi:hypothetical protein